VGLSSGISEICRSRDRLSVVGSQLGAVDSSSVPIGHVGLIVYTACTCYIIYTLFPAENIPILHLQYTVRGPLIRRFVLCEQIDIYIVIPQTI
jgi:hypothetical protein